MPILKKDVGVGMYFLSPDFVLEPIWFRKLVNKKGNSSYHLGLSLGWWSFEIYYGNVKEMQLYGK